jgi:hypothetical protein
LDFYSASSLKQQSADRHVAPLGHIIVIQSQPVFALTPHLGDVLNIVDNKKALDGKKLSDQATALEDAANEMENEMKQLDEVFATPSSGEKELIPIPASRMK